LAETRCFEQTASGVRQKQRNALAACSGPAAPPLSPVERNWGYQMAWVAEWLGGLTKS